MPFEIVRNDIIKMPVDAIVNAANSALKMGGGVCGAIFSAAGADELQAECNRIGSCEVGQAVMTKGYNLPAKHIIHTVGPVWHGGNNNESQKLSDCYTNSLLLAHQNHLESIAFPLISSGIFGYPKEEALKIAVSSIGEFLLKQDMMVYLVVYDEKSFVLGEKLFSSIKEYIDSHYVDEHQFNRSSRRIAEEEFFQIDERTLFRSVAESSESCDPCKPFAPCEPSEPSEPSDPFGPCKPDADQPARVFQPLQLPKSKRNLTDVLAHMDETFSQMLLRFIDEKGMTDVETYKKANIDRKLFSKIRGDKHYNPSKITAIAFAIALQLNHDETRDLLARAGYTLSNSSKFDVIIQYFIEEGNYNIFEINEALFAFQQPLLGA